MNIVKMRKKNLNTIISDMRSKSGLSQQDLANSCGMTLSEYRDIEDYNDNIYMATQLKELNCICVRLGIKIDDLMMENAFTESILPRDIICKRMDEKHISSLELSDMVGIEVAYISNIKHDIRKLGNWVVDPIIFLSESLGLSFSALLKSYADYSEGKEIC